MSLKRKIVLLSLLFTGLLFYVIIFHLLARFPVQDEVYRDVLARFWQQPILVLSIFAGFGAFYISELLLLFRKTLFIVFSTALAFIQLGFNFKNSDQTKQTLFYEFGKNLLSPMPAGTVYFPFGDIDYFITLYLQRCEDLRPDIIILSQSRLSRSWYFDRVRLAFPRLNFAEGPFTLNNFFNSNLNNFPIFISSRQPDPQIWEYQYDAWPFGFSDKILRKNNIPSTAELRTKDSWGPFPNILAAQTNFAAWQAHLSNRYWWSKNRRTQLLQQAIERSQNENSRKELISIVQEIR